MTRWSMKMALRQQTEVVGVGVDIIIEEASVEEVDTEVVSVVDTVVASGEDTVGTEEVSEEEVSIMLAFSVRQLSE